MQDSGGAGGDGLADLFPLDQPLPGDLLTPRGWAVSAGAGAKTSGSGIAVDRAGNSYITGSFAGKAKFGTVSLGALGEQDIFVAKLAPTGKLLWAVSGGGVKQDIARGISVDSAGSCYITGSFSGMANFGATTVKSGGGDDIFIAKLSPAGKFLWATAAGGSDMDCGNAIAVDKAANSHLTGFFTNTATFGTVTLKSGGDADVFVARLSPAGKFLWATAAGGIANDSGGSIAVDSSGNSTVTGSFVSKAVFGPATLSVKNIRAPFVARLNSAGKFLWAATAGGSDFGRGMGVALDSAGNSYAVGLFKGTATFGATTISSSGPGDAFITRLSPAGKFLWAATAGGSGLDTGASIALDSVGNSHVAGEFTGAATFGSFSLSSSGQTDIFVTKLSPAGKFLWATSAGGSGPDAGASIALDSAGSQYVTGTFSGQAFFGATRLPAPADVMAQSVFAWRIDP